MEDKFEISNELDKANCKLTTEEKLRLAEEKIVSLEERIEADRNAIMQIQFEAKQHKQEELDLHETYVWRTGLRMEKVLQKTGIAFVRSLLEIADSGAIALGGEGRIVNPLYAAKKIYAVKRISFYLQLAASAISFVGILVLMLLSLSSYLTPMVFGLYYLGWTVVSAILSFALINRRTLYLGREK